MKFKFKKDAKAEIGTEGPLYSLFNGGYLDPYLVLDDEKQADKVSECVAIIEEFITACQEKGVIEEA